MQIIVKDSCDNNIVSDGDVLVYWDGYAVHKHEGEIIGVALILNDELVGGLRGQNAIDFIAEVEGEL